MLQTTTKWFLLSVIKFQANLRRSTTSGTTSKRMGDFLEMMVFLTFVALLKTRSDPSTFGFVSGEQFLCTVRSELKPKVLGSLLGIIVPSDVPYRWLVRSDIMHVQILMGFNQVG